MSYESSATAVGSSLTFLASEHVDCVRGDVARRIHHFADVSVLNRESRAPHCRTLMKYRRKNGPRQVSQRRVPLLSG